MIKIPTYNSVTVNMCRICLSTENLSNSIFSKSPVNNMTFAQILTTCTSVKILIDDGFPSLICDNCLESLESFFNLCQRCIDSDSVLRNNQNLCVENSFHQLKNSSAIVKIEEDSAREWQECNSESKDVIEDEYSPFVFVSVEERTDECQSKWCSQEKINIKKENESAEHNFDNEMCLIKSHIEIDRKNEAGEIIDDVSKKWPDEIYARERNKNMKEGSKIRRFQCDICGKPYSNKYSLTLHVRTHTGERPYKCPLCPKSFAQKVTLNIHSLTHSGERSFSCEKCGKSFTQKSNLLKHMTVHTGEQRFRCDICSKQFSQKNHLASHAHTHSGEKPYECKTCGKKFSLKCGLRMHETTHSDLKPFKCETCGKTFSKRGSCKIHEQIHTGEKPYQCQICNRAFGRKDKLKAHLRIHSNENKKYLIKKTL